MIEFHLVRYDSINGRKIGELVSISVDKISYFRPDGEHTEIHFTDRYIDVWESYDEVKDAIDGVLK